MKDQVYIYNLAQKFSQIVQEHGQRPVFKYPSGEVFTYTQLNELSDKIFTRLVKKGMQQGEVVAIFNQKSPLAFATMLACIKGGFIYTNIDITSPWQRVEKIIRTCQPKMVCYDGNETPFEAEIGSVQEKTHFFLLKEENFSTETADQKVLQQYRERITGSMPAYIMFTSGSTGIPKGAVMSHQNLLHFIKWGKQTYAVTPNDVFTNVNPIYFDNSVFDFYTSVFNGASMVPVGHQEIKDARFTVNAIGQGGCTIWFSVPSMLVYLLTTKALTKDDLGSIKHIAFGGEGFPKNKLKQLYDMFGHRAALHNVYGPTECTCICSSHRIVESDFLNMNELTTLGKIAPNFDYVIFPQDGNPDMGELALGGPCVGLGYYNDPERTGLSFVQNPNVRYNKIMYKTGDLVERDVTGNLFFRGRIDNQIKHMGYRIELEEIEAAFNSLDVIDEAGVVYERISADYGQIKAFVKMAGSENDPKKILDLVKQLLPPYMVPKQVIILDGLPKNANGKIDRKQLLQIK